MHIDSPESAVGSQFCEPRTFSPQSVSDSLYAVNAGLGSTSRSAQRSAPEGHPWLPRKTPGTISQALRQPARQSAAGSRLDTSPFGTSTNCSNNSVEGATVTPVPVGTTSPCRRLAKRARHRFTLLDNFDSATRRPLRHDFGILGSGRLKWLQENIERFMMSNNRRRWWWWGGGEGRGAGCCVSLI